MISPGSERPERILLGERRDLKRLENHVRLILQLGGKRRGKEADHTQTRDLLGRAWKWIMCWGIFPHPKLGALQMELGWVCFGELCSSQKNAEVRQEWYRCVWKVGSQNSSDLAELVRNHS